MNRSIRPRWLLPALLAAASPLALGVAIAPTPAAAQVAVDVTATVAPPPLIEYDQPPIPAPGYLWTPGYWAWGAAGYYWVPGTWVEPPQVGLLWTPPWWGFEGGRYLFHVGYWGPTVGFYGGINYGFGYFGLGFEGGYWRGGSFFYNSAVNHFGGVHITNVYTRNVTNITNVTVNRVSFNGPGGVTRAPTPEEQAAARAQHIQPTPAQTAHFQAAAQNRELLASVNHGRPPITATSRPGDFHAAPASPRPAAENGWHSTPATTLHAAPPVRAAGEPGPMRPPAYHPPAAYHAGPPPGTVMRVPPHPMPAPAPHPQAAPAHPERPEPPHH